MVIDTRLLFHRVLAHFRIDVFFLLVLPIVT